MKTNYDKARELMFCIEAGGIPEEGLQVALQKAAIYANLALADAQRDR